MIRLKSWQWFILATPKNGKIKMTTKLTEIKEMIFQLPKEEINQLIKEIKEIMATKDFMQLAETRFSEWNHPEEDIY